MLVGTISLFYSVLTELLVKAWYKTNNSTKNRVLNTKKYEETLLLRTQAEVAERYDIRWIATV